MTRAHSKRFGAANPFEVVWPFGCVLLVMILCEITSAQDQAQQSLRLIERPPFDRITLHEDAGGATYDIRALDLPDRKIPDSPPPNEQLKVYLIEQKVDAEIAWRDIAKVDLFEQLVLAKADALVADKKFNEAFDYFDYLHRLYPNVTGLKASTHAYWYRNAGALFQEGEYTSALALLDQLHFANPDYNGLAAALKRVTDRLMTNYLKEEKYAAARRLLQQTRRRSGAEDPSAAAWSKAIQSAASDKLNVAKERYANNEYLAARNGAHHALDIWPTIAGANELLSQIDRAHPIIVVAVPDGKEIVAIAPRLHPALLRRQHLTTRPLVRLRDYGGSGPRHESTWGTVKLASDRKHVEILLSQNDESTARLTGYDVADYLLSATKHSNELRRTSLVESVEVEDVFSARLHFARGHVSPLSVLARLTLGENQPASDYVNLGDDDNTRFVGRRGQVSAAAPQEIVERHSLRPADDADDLRFGSIDFIAELDLSKLNTLREDDSIEIRPYPLPTVHVLIPNAKRPFSNSRTFRRALAYGIDRERILESSLLAGSEVPNFQTVSGVCPTSPDGDEFWALGYDRDIAPLPYEPALAITLQRVAHDELIQSASRQNRDALEFDQIVIGHEDHWLYAKATQAIVDDLHRLGITARTLTLSIEADFQQCDFIYAELLMREPVIDVGQLLNNPYLPQSGALALQLRQLKEVTNWQQARDQLHAIHATVHAEQTVIPLWQLQPHFAFRTNVGGVSESPLTLYQGARDWRLKARIPLASEIAEGE